MTVELHRPVPLERIGPVGLTVTVEATPGECQALTTRLAIPAVANLLCRFALHRADGSTIEADALLQARVTRTCVVSLEDFETEIVEAFTLRFVPAGSETDDPDPESPDEIPYVGDKIDLGDAAAEQLALALDPFPRAENATLPETPAEGDGDLNPFSALASMRRAPG